MPRTIVCSSVDDPIPMEFATQDVEGLKIVIQAMVKAALALKNSLRSDWLRVTFGDAVTKAECCDLHHQVVSYQHTMECASRFSRANFQAALQEVRSHKCQHRAPALHG